MLQKILENNIDIHLTICNNIHMKKVVILSLALALSGCASVNKSAEIAAEEEQEDVKREAIIETYKAPVEELMAEEKVPNQNCIKDIENLVVFQTMDDEHGLATYDRGQKRHNVAMFRLPSAFVDRITIYDDVKIDVPASQCLVINDTFAYKTRAGYKKVVPVITFEDEMEPKNKKKPSKAAKKKAKVKQKTYGYKDKHDKLKVMEIKMRDEEEEK